MKDRSFEYPCILDPNRVCPLSKCDLYITSVGVILKVSNHRKETPEEFVVKLRSGSGQDIEDFRTVNAHMLAKADKITQCAHYPDSVIGLPTSVLDLED